MPSLRRVNADIYLSFSPLVNLLAALLPPLVVYLASCLSAQRQQLTAA